MIRLLTFCLLLITAVSVTGTVSEFRIDQDRLWLQVENEPLNTLLAHFSAAGINVEMDPGVQKSVSGNWQGVDLEKALGDLIVPYDYFLDWRRQSSPLGSRIVLNGIRVYRKGFPEQTEPLGISRRVVTAIDGHTRYLAREILVGFGLGTSMEDLQAFLARTGGTVMEASETLGVYRILLPENINVPELAEQLANDPAISLAEPNYVYDLPELLPGGTSTGEKPQWIPPSGNGEMAVAVLDSGLIADEALSSAVLSAYDATNPNAPLTADAVGHGTLMAKLAAGLVDPYRTPVGEGVPVVVVKAFADDGSADSYTLMNAMTHAVENSSGPVSLSWGTETPSKFIETAVRYAINSGSPVFAAVGNENTGRSIYPAAYPGVIGVAAGTADGQYTEYSNRGNFVDIIAPGSAGGSQGTSVATAYVSHVAGLYMQHNPNASASDTVAALIEAAGDDRYLSEGEVRHLLAK